MEVLCSLTFFSTHFFLFLIGFPHQPLEHPNGARSKEFARNSGFSRPSDPYPGIGRPAVLKPCYVTTTSLPSRFSIENQAERFPNLFGDLEDLGRRDFPYDLFGLAVDD